MEADHGLPGLLRRDHDVQHLFQGHFGAVVDFTAGLGVVQQLGIDEGTGVDDDVGFGEELRAPDGDKIGSAAAGAYKMNHGGYSFTMMVVK